VQLVSLIVKTGIEYDKAVYPTIYYCVVGEEGVIVATLQLLITVRIN
jgi:hypothetical protein